MCRIGAFTIEFRGMTYLGMNILLCRKSSMFAFAHPLRSSVGRPQQIEVSVLDPT